LTNEGKQTELIDYLSVALFNFFITKKRKKGEGDGWQRKNKKKMVSERKNIGWNRLTH
jgi:hypothetical protein